MNVAALIVATESSGPARRLSRGVSVPHPSLRRRMGHPRVQLIEPKVALIVCFSNFKVLFGGVSSPARFALSFDAPGC